MIKEVTVISWDESSNIYGVQAQKKSDFILNKITVLMSESDNLFENINEVYKSFSVKKSSYIVLSGIIPGSIIFDISIPEVKAEEIKSLLEFELPRHIPIPLDEIIWSFTVYSNKNNVLKIRVFAIKEHEWNLFIEELSELNIKLDALIDPFYLLKNIKEKSNKQRIVKGEKFQFYNENLLTINSLNEELKEKLKYGELIADLNYDEKEYSLKDYAEIDQNIEIADIILGQTQNSIGHKLIQLPKEMYPVRALGIKILTGLTSLLFVFVSLLYVSQIINSKVSAKQKALVELNSIEKKISVLKTELLKNKLFDDSIAILNKEKNENSINVIEALIYFSAILPKHIWIDKLSFGNNKLRVVFKSSGEINSLLKIIGKSKLYYVGNDVKTRSSRKESYLTLSIYKRD